MSDGSQVACPELRATVARRGDVVMTRWSAGSACPGGPAASQSRVRRLAGVFDLTIERERADGIVVAAELIVADAFVAGDAAPAHRSLIAWAVRLGYRRVWLPCEVVALAPALLGGRWESACHHCGSTWSDSTTGFRLTARAAGFFPLACSLCSHPLAEPVAERAGVAVASGAGTPAVSLVAAVPTEGGIWAEGRVS